LSSKLVLRSSSCERSFARDEANTDRPPSSADYLHARNASIGNSLVYACLPCVHRTRSLTSMGLLGTGISRWVRALAHPHRLYHFADTLFLCCTGGAISMCAHRSSLLEHSTVAGAVLGLDIVVANGTIVSLNKDAHGTTDAWYAATCNLGLLGVLVRAKMRIVPEFKIQANQKM